MTNQEINRLYNQLDGLSPEEIEKIVSKELGVAAGGGIVGAGIFAGAICGAVFNNKWTPEKVMAICKTSVANASQSIRKIMHDNPKATNYSLEIIQLVDPAIAQQYCGISGMAIVGSLSILCKQGISNYIS